MKEHIQAIVRAIGTKRFTIGGVVGAVIASYGSVRDWLVNRGLDILPALPSVEIGLGAVLVLLVWWLASYILELEAKLKSKLQLMFHPRYPYEVTHPAEATGLATRIMRVEVTNTGTMNLDNCLVKLERIKRLDSGSFVNAFTPVGLLTQHQHLQGRKGGAFTLRGGETKFVEVAFLDESNSLSEIGLQYEHREYANGIPRGSYELTLVAYGGDSPVERHFKLFVDTNGRLRFEAL